MRKALGLKDPALQRKPKPERADQGHRPAGRSALVTQRRRFVQDGDVPVTLVRREPPTDLSRSRLQQVEAQLAAETAARAQAERALAEALSQTRDLQTKLGHAELAKNEAEERAWHAEKVLAGLQDSFEQERAARIRAERVLHLAEEAGAAAKRRLQELSQASPAPYPRSTTPEAAPKPEPVKWWLAPAPAATRSRRH